jgi:hypothetical protein
MPSTTPPRGNVGRSLSRRRAYRSRAVSAATVLLLIALAGCGSDADQGADTVPAEPVAAAPTTVGIEATTVAESGPAADLDRVRAGLLTAPEIGAGWLEVGAQMNFPNRIELARTIPECDAVADLVFDGGSVPRAERARAFVRGNDAVFTHVTLFADASTASRAIEAIADPSFDACWAPYNEAASKAGPIGITAASYAPAEPPTIDVVADAVAVKHVAGSVTIGGTELADSCVCVFAQVGRAVVAVHSAEPVLDLAARIKLVQTAVDKLAAAVAS